MTAADSQSLIGTPCKRCKEEPTVIVSRKDNFCKKCFIKFIRGKQRKQMAGDRFKIKYGTDLAKIAKETPKVLLPLSLGKSSLVLVDIIVSLLEEHVSTVRGHLGFETLILVIDESKTVENVKDPVEIVESLKSFYGVEKLKNLRISIKVLNPDSFIYSLDSLRRLHLTNDYLTFIGDSHINKTDFTLSSLLAQCPNKSTKEDFMSVILEDLIFKTAISNNCSVILYGHCMTKLADDVIALTVRGRGAEISKRLTDGQVDYQGTTLEILHPLRDVLQTEINAYCDLSDLIQFCSSVPIVDGIRKTAKSKTINELTRDYFEVIEKDYPETVSTVVKIGSKLASPDVMKTTDKICTLCNNPLYHEPKEWLEQIIVNGGAPLETEEEKEQLNIYLKSIEGEQQYSYSNTDSTSLCYGCIVSLGGSSKDGFVWPVKRQSKEEILKEFILTDDEDDE